MVKAGPKAATVTAPLSMRGIAATGGARVVGFVERYLQAPKGVGARERLRVRDWQRALVGGVFDEPRPRQALWAMPRGNGKSTLAAALGLYGLYGDGVEGASEIVVAADER